MCYGQTIPNIKKLTYEMARINSISVPENWTANKRAGHEWYIGFMFRNKQLSLRRPEGCSLSRATSFNKNNVSKFFEILENIYERYGTFNGGTRIYNLDETATTAEKLLLEKE